MKRLIQLKLSQLKKDFPNFPEYALPEVKYTDKTANGLTKAVCEFLNLSGHQAERISTTGRYIDESKIVTDYLGHHKRIGSGKYIPGNGTKGSADISAVIKGRAVKIEVKMKDKQSLHQIKYQQDIENAGGQYWLVHSFDDFEFHYDSFLDYMNK